MKEIPTAEEFLKQYQKGGDSFCVTKGEAINKLVEFAKLHVQACKEDIKNNAEVFDSWNSGLAGSAASLDKDSIDKCYPLTNIK